MDVDNGVALVTDLSNGAVVVLAPVVMLAFNSHVNYGNYERSFSLLVVPPGFPKVR